MQPAATADDGSPALMRSLDAVRNEETTIVAYGARSSREHAAESLGLPQRRKDGRGGRLKRLKWTSLDRTIDASRARAFAQESTSWRRVTRDAAEIVQRGVSSTVSDTPAFTTSKAKAGCWSSRSVPGSVLCSFPARHSTPPSSKLGLPPHAGGRLLLAAAAALEPLDQCARWAALFGAFLEEATGDRVAYPAALAGASLPSHALKLPEPTCSFNFPARPPHHHLVTRLVDRAERIDQGRANTCP